MFYRWKFLRARGFRELGFIEDVIDITKMEWLKWSFVEILCNRHVPLTLKKNYFIRIR